MKNFQFYFNPNSGDRIYDTFCFEPENKKEEKLGNLYMAGMTDKNSSTLPFLAEKIKNEYYKNNESSQNDNFKKSLQKANEFLLSQKKENKVGWLDDLDFVILTISSNFHMNFVKIGKLKTFVLKSDEIFNIGTEREQTNSDNLFQNIITGELLEENKVLITNENIFNLLEKNSILERLTKCSIKSINPIFNSQKELLKNIFGFCLLTVLTPNKRKLIRFYLPHVNFPKISFPKTNYSFSDKLIPLKIKIRLKKSFISILILIILLILGSLLF
jgi:hypothetical protein